MEGSERIEAALGGKAESILAAAKRAFLANGFGAVSMDTIARDAGVSKATVYAHFAGKEELFGAVIGRECERRFDDLSVSELDPRTVRISLTTLGRRFLDFILSGRDRSAPHHPRRGHPVSGARRGVLARRSRAQPPPDRSISRERGRFRSAAVR